MRSIRNFFNQLTGGVRISIGSIYWRCELSRPSRVGPGSPTPRSALPQAGPGGHDVVHAVQLSALEMAGAGNGRREEKKPKLGVALRGGAKGLFSFFLKIADRARGGDASAVPTGGGPRMSEGARGRSARSSHHETSTCCGALERAPGGGRSRGTGPLAPGASPPGRGEEEVLFIVFCLISCHSLNVLA